MRPVMEEGYLEVGRLDRSWMEVIDSTVYIMILVRKTSKLPRILVLCSLESNQRLIVQDI